MSSKKKRDIEYKIVYPMSLANTQRIRSLPPELSTPFPVTEYCVVGQSLPVLKKTRSVHHGQWWLFCVEKFRGSKCFYFTDKNILYYPVQTMNWVKENSFQSNILLDPQTFSSQNRSPPANMNWMRMHTTTSRVVFPYSILEVITGGAIL